MRNTIYHDLGLMNYQEVYDIQEKYFNELIDKKLNRVNDLTHHLVFCEHPHVYTLGKSGSENNLLIDYIQLQAKQATFIKTNRGGDITYHGPGQIVGYPIFDLEKFDMQARLYIHTMEEAIINTMRYFNIETTRLEGSTGVWIDVNTKNARKICAIGVRISRGVTMHGFALNVNTDLSYFNFINPCGYTDKKATSIEKEIGQKVDFELVKNLVKDNFKDLYQLNFV